MQLTISELVIVESLPPGDRQTGSELHHHLTRVAPLTIPVALERIQTRVELLMVLHQLAARAEREQWLPMIHIEVHGDETGCSTATGEYLTWDELAGPLRRINVAVRNSLVVAVSACKGVYIASAAADNPFEPSPFCGAIGPDVEVFDAALFDGYSAFYAELIRSRDFVLALHELQQNHLPEARVFDLADLFRKSVDRYQESFMQGPLYKRRLTRIMRKHAKAGTHLQTGRKVSRREIARKMHNNNGRLHRYWEHFIMADLYPENLARFRPLHVEGIGTV
jgi:hypothetical protein